MKPPITYLLAILAFIGLSSCSSEEQKTTQPIIVNQKAEQETPSPPPSKEVISPNHNGTTLYVKVPHLYVRSGPSMQYLPVSTIPFNAPITVKGTLQGGTWIKINEGQYVGSKYLSTDKNATPWIPEDYAH